MRQKNKKILSSTYKEIKEKIDTHSELERILLGSFEFRVSHKDIPHRYVLVIYLQSKFKTIRVLPSGLERILLGNPDFRVSHKDIPSSNSEAEP